MRSSRSGWASARSVVGSVMRTDAKVRFGICDVKGVFGNGGLPPRSHLPAEFARRMVRARREVRARCVRPSVGRARRLFDLANERLIYRTGADGRTAGGGRGHAVAAGADREQPSGRAAARGRVAERAGAGRGGVEVDAVTAGGRGGQPVGRDALGGRERPRHPVRAARRDADGAGPGDPRGRPGVDPVDAGRLRGGAARTRPVARAARRLRHRAGARRAAAGGPASQRLGRARRRRGGPRAGGAGERAGRGRPGRLRQLPGRRRAQLRGARAGVLDGAGHAAPGIMSRSAPGVRSAVRQGVRGGLAWGAYGISFGALRVAAGLDVWRTCVLSLLMFAGGSQFAFVGVIGAGGAGAAATATAALLGVRNSLYGLQMASLLRPRGRWKPAAAHLTIDESTAVALAQPADDLPARRAGFWATGLAVF